MRIKNGVETEVGLLRHLTSDASVSRRSLLRLFGGVAATSVLGGLLTACGGDDDDDSSSSDDVSSSATESSDTSSDSATDAGGDELAAESSDSSSEDQSTSGDESSDEGSSESSDKIAIFASAVDIPNIDPAVGHDGAISETQKALYDTLYRHMHPDSELVPWLATGHEVTDDAVEWIFTLDDRAKFQDGSPLTADTVVYSLQRLLKVNKGVAWMFSGVMSESGVTAVDDHTVKFTLDKPFAPFLHATAWLFVLNPAIVKEHESGDDLAQDWLLDHSAGSGPFKIKRWQPGSVYEFESDPNYWRGWDGPRLAGYIRQISRESSTKRLALSEGSIHAADWLSVEDIQLLKSEEGVVVPEKPSISTYTIKLNNKRGPTSDINVRRAISYAFDYDAMIGAMAGRATRITGPLAPTIKGVKEDIVGYSVNIEKAKEELAKSDEWKDGFEIEFMYVTGLEEERKTGLILLDQLSKLNIKVTITPVEWANAVALFSDPEQSPLMFPISSGSDYPDPDNFLWQSFHSSSAGTWMGANHYSNPEVDDLLEDARATTVWDERAELYGQVQEIVVDEAVEIFCYSELGGLVHREELKGYEYCPVMGAGNFWYLMHF